MNKLKQNIKKLISCVGVDRALDSLEEMINQQVIKTFKELNEAIEEELVLLEVEAIEKNRSCTLADSFIRTIFKCSRPSRR